MSQQHIIFMSGGIGSYIAAKRVIAKYPGDRMWLLFTDTLTEDKDLYRFLIETVAALQCRSSEKMVRGLIEQSRRLPEHIDPDFPDAIERLRKDARALLGVVSSGLLLQWICHGSSVWDLFDERAKIGNNFMDECSWALKRQISKKFVESTFKDDRSVTLHFGIDHSERLRFFGNGTTKTGIQKRWIPYRCEAPLCEPPYLTKTEMIQECERDGIDPPRIYDEGFPHNNCGGFCVKAGKAHFRHLLKARRDVFLYNERREQEWQERHGKPYTVMTETVNGKKIPLSMLEFRKREEAGCNSVDQNDWGNGCQCFTPEQEDKVVDGL